MIFQGIDRPEDVKPLPGPFPTFHDRVWGELHKLHLPSSAVSPGINQLKSTELSVLVALYSIERNQRLRHQYSQNPITDSIGCITAKHSKLRELTGLSKNQPTIAIKGLEAKGYIRKESTDQPRNESRQFAVNQYRLLNPVTCVGLETRSRKPILLANGIKYFTVPAVLFRKTLVFAGMSIHAQRLYLTVCWLASINRSNSFDTTTKDLRKITQLSAFTFSKALAEVQERFLLAAIPKGTTLHNLHVMLYDPTTQEPVSASLENADYYQEDGKGRFHRASLKLGQDEAERRVTQALLAISETPTRIKGDMRFRCPFHDDSTPSFSFNPNMGCYHCFGCEASGNTVMLLQHLTSTQSAPASRVIAELVPTARRIKPDSEAVAIYSYIDQYETLVKQKLKFREPNGSATYWQRQRKDGKYVYSVKELKPILFNRNLFDGANTVFICEGEKDACTMQALRFSRSVGTTSGAATSWDARFAKDLKEFSNVIIMPDDDAAGERYSQQIQDSLNAEDIAFKVVSFQGTGAKDVSEYLESHSIEDLKKLIGYEETVNKSDEIITI